MKVLRKKNLFILVHFLCWGIFSAEVLYSHPFETVTVPTTFWIRQTILLITLMIVFYLNYYLLIPRLLIRQKVWFYIIIAVLLVIVVTWLNSTINASFNLNEFAFNRPHPSAHFGGFDRRHFFRHSRFDLFVPGMNLLVIGLGITISFIRKWQQELTLRQQLEQEKISSELILLKAQINPHFFFNTLNTIYSYTLSDGDMARASITKLSKMMRYVLYDAANGQTALSKEIAFIRDYIELMKLRTSVKTKIDFIVSENLKEYMIAPMLFLPFVENAFKHGVSSIAEGYIYITVIQNADGVTLTVTNTVYETRRVSEDQSNGIGILNTTRRLELLYPGKYLLTTGIINGTEYQAKLTLFL